MELLIVAVLTVFITFSYLIITGPGECYDCGKRFKHHRVYISGDKKHRCIDCIIKTLEDE